MAFIGIIAEKQKYEFLKNYLANDMNKNDITLININKNSISNLQRVKFDAIVILNSLEKIINESQAINNICKNVKYLILNSDIEFKEISLNNNNKDNNISLNTIEDLFQNIKTNIISFGLNQKATVTISSVTDEDMLISVQRAFKDWQNKMVEQGDYNCKIGKVDRINLQEVLVGFIIEKLYYNQISK